jgi:hypothetical protein
MAREPSSPSGWDREFESVFLQRGVCELSVPDRIRVRIAAWYTSSFTLGASLSFLFGRVGTLLGWRSAFVIAGILGRRVPQAFTEDSYAGISTESNSVERRADGKRDASLNRRRCSTDKVDAVEAGAVVHLTCATGKSAAAVSLSKPRRIKEVVVV